MLGALAGREHRAGRLAEAAAAYRQILALRPDSAETYNHLGNVLLRQGKYDEAAARIRTSTGSQARSLRGAQQLGCIFQQQGKLDQALARFEQAIALAPNYAEAYNNLGNVLKDQGRTDEAAAQYERAATLKPGLVQAHINLGDIRRRQGQFDQALARFEHAIALRPDYAEAHYNLGVVLSDQGKVDDAVAQLERAAALKPDLLLAHINLGDIFWQQGKLDQAAGKLHPGAGHRPTTRRSAQQPGHGPARAGQARRGRGTLRASAGPQAGFRRAHHNLGTTLMNQRKFDEAAAQYERALALNPELIPNTTQPRHHLPGAGQARRGRGALRTSAGPQARSSRAALQRANLKTFRAGDPDLAALEAIAADSGDLPPGKMLYIHFALGKALEDIGDYPRAFEHLLLANALKRREVQYDEAACQRNFQLIAELFDSRTAGSLRRRRAIPRQFRSSSSACLVPAARSSSRFWPATRWSTPPAN